MDTVLELVDTHVYDPLSIYPTKWSSHDYIPRQIIGLLIILNVGSYLLYFLTAGTSYLFLFDKRLKTHPLYLKNQILLEVSVSCRSMPQMSILTLPFILLEVRGYSRLHNEVGVVSTVVSLVSFILFTDCLIYWIHRGLHNPWAYKTLHKVHHKWKVPTPFASHAFHPMDGFLQSLPYHLYVFLFPMNKYLYLAMFIFVNIWTVSIHDGVYAVPRILKEIVNGSAHHTDHHLFYNYNYGQFFTLWDRIGKSFREPSAFSGDGPIDQLLKKH